MPAPVRGEPVAKHFDLADELALGRRAADIGVQVEEVERFEQPALLDGREVADADRVEPRTADAAGRIGGLQPGADGARVVGELRGLALEVRERLVVDREVARQGVGARVGRHAARDVVPVRGGVEETAEGRHLDALRDRHRPRRKAEGEHADLPQAVALVVGNGAASGGT